MKFITIILIGLSLSMDAFSLSLLYGSKKISNHYLYKLVITVGIFHFIMPLLGHFLGNGILILVEISSSILMFLILSIVGTQMILDSLKNEKKIDNEGALLFALAVSMDSFSIGLSLNEIVDSIFIAPIIFMIISALFTYIGLKLGNVINKKIGKTATLLGGITLILIAIVHIL